MFTENLMIIDKQTIKGYLITLGAMLVGAGLTFILMANQVNRAKSEKETIQAVAEAILVEAKKR